MVSLQLQNITKTFGTAIALQHLDWKLEDGQFGIVLGPSGSGKTTLLKIIAGLLPPDSGSILFANKSVLKQSASERNVGYVPQGLALFPHLTVEKNLAFGLEARHWKKHDIQKKITELLILGEIEDLSKRYPREISGGQQQRVALLRALAPQPQILLLDEPLGSLEARLRSRMLGVIKSIQKATRITTVLVSHDPQETIFSADNVLVIDRGSVVQAGSPIKVLSSPVAKASAILGMKNMFRAKILQSGGGKLLLDTLFGHFQISIPGDIANQELLGIQVPPSQIKLLSRDGASQDSIVIEGTVSRIAYLGDQAEIAITVSNSQSLLFVNVHSDVVGLRYLETGQSLECEFLPSDIKVLWVKAE
ncbi:MAG: ABC transporter ATP-binding protein [Candidatus Heimdallarchaeota archaeon]